MTDETTPKKPVSWFEPILLLGAITLIVWLGFAGLPSADHDHHRDGTRLLVHSEILQQNLQALQAKASHYLDNAPREYEHYFRDTTISHIHFQTDIELVETHLQALVSIGSEPSANSAQGETPALPRLQQHWAGFRQQLQEQLGIDPEMPRLEWGARHIAENTAPLIAALGDVSAGLQGSAQSASAAASRQPPWAWPALAAWLVMALVWFGLRVRRSPA